MAPPPPPPPHAARVNDAKVGNKSVFLFFCRSEVIVNFSFMV